MSNSNIYKNYIFHSLNGGNTENTENTENAENEFHGGLSVSEYIHSNRTNIISGGSNMYQFKDLVIPFGLILENPPINLHNIINQENQDIPEIKVVSDIIFNKLFNSIKSKE